MYQGFPSLLWKLLDNIFHCDCVLVAVSYCLQGDIQLSLAGLFFCFDVTGQNLNRVKMFWPRLNLHFLCLLALLIRELGLGEKENLEST